MSDIPVSVDTYFTSFYYFMKDKGFEIESAIYDRENDEYACMFIFKEGTDFKKLVNFMHLPKQDMNTSVLVSSKDNSYSIGLHDDGKIIMTMDKKHHTAIICYIMANR